MAPSEMASKLKLTLPTISDTLRILRKVDLVRYETQKNHKIYFLKEPKIIKVLKELEKIVENLRFLKW